VRTARAAAFALALVAGPAPAQILGEKPAYLGEVAASIPNDQAVLRRIWAPGVEEGYVPQGLAVDDRYLYVTGYRSTDAKVSSGPCRVFRVELETGRAAGFFDMPPECGHSGGAVSIGGGQLVVSDTRQLWRIDLAAALKSGKAADGLRGTVKLAGDLYGSFLTFDGTDLWIGRYTVQKEADAARIHRLALKVFDDHDGRTITEAQVAETFKVPALGQGAAVDKDHIWMSASSSQIGALYRLDRKGGNVLARYETIIGIEGIAFDAQGRLWAVSEAGARKWLHWKSHFPVMFLIDPAKLQ